MIFFKQRRSAERDAFSVPRSVQKSIPIKRIYQDGVFQVSGKFSKTWRFFDVNYAVASPEKQRELFMTYCSFLNSLPIGATAKITLFNRQLNQKDFGRTLLMPMQGDRRDLYRNEYRSLSRLIHSQISHTPESADMLYLENFIGNRITNLDGAKPSKWRAMIRTERRIWASDSASLHLCVASQVAMTSVQLTILPR